MTSFINASLEIPPATLPADKTGKPLKLIPVPYLVPEQRRSRFLFQGDATRPISGIEIEPPLSSRYSILDSSAVSVPRPFRLKIQHFNDFHGHISNLNSGSSQPIFSRIAARYHRQQHKYAQNPEAGVLLLSAGDDMVGSPFDVLVNDDVHSYKLYQSLGVDAAALGNHDLDFGVDALAEIIDNSGGFPVLSANLVPCSPLQSRVYPAALIDVKGVRVGLIGLTTAAQMKGADARHLNFADPVAVLHNLLPVLRPYCHILIILSHLGYDLHSTTATVEGYGDRQLAEQLPYSAVDLIIGGHTHDILNEAGLSPNNIVNGIPIVQAGNQGRFLGEVTITIRGDRPAPTVTNAKLLATADLPVSQAFEQQQIVPMLNALHEKLECPLGEVISHPHLGVDAVVNDFASGESAFANFFTAAMVAQARKHGYRVDFALTDAAILRNGLLPGKLCYGDWFAVVPHADTLRLYQLSGLQLQQLLQDNARRANRLGEPHLERGFIQFSGQVRYRIALGKEYQDTQATDIFVMDQPLANQLDHTFRFVTHSFIRQPAIPWEKSHQSLDLMQLDMFENEDLGLLLRDEIIEYIAQFKGVTTAAGVKCDRRLEIIS